MIQVVAIPKKNDVSKYFVVGSLLFLLLSVLFLSYVILNKTSFAAIWDGRAANHGYYNNQYGNSNSPYPDHLGPVIDNEDYKINAIPTSITNVDELYTYMYNLYVHAGGQTYGYPTWESTGISFIVNTMLGRAAGGAGRSISAADWANLHARLDALAVSAHPPVFNTTINDFGINTYYQYPLNDVAYYGDNKQAEGMVFYDSAGNIMYELFNQCANPAGDFNGLPPAPIQTYTLTPSISTSVSTAEANTPISVTPSVSNSGNEVSKNTTWTVSSYTVSPTGVKSATKPGETGTGVFSLGASAAFSATGGNAWGTESGLTLPDVAAGSEVCYILTVSPHSSSDGSAIQSPPACVTIGTAPKVDVLGSDLLVGRTFTGNPLTSQVTTSISTSASNTITKPETGVIAGLYGTGVDNNGNIVSYATPGATQRTAIKDSHWSIATIAPGTSGDNPCQGTTGSTWTYGQQATLVDLDYDNTSYSPAITGPAAAGPNAVWTNRTVSNGGANGAWIGNNIAASDSYYQQTTNASCTFPANYHSAGPYPAPYNAPPASNTTSQEAAAAYAPTWTFKTTFNVTSPESDCTVDPNSVQLTLSLLADDGATVLINGQRVGIKVTGGNTTTSTGTVTPAAGQTSLPDNANWSDQWTATPITFTTNITPNLFTVGQNTLEIQVRSLSTATGLLVLNNSSSTANCVQGSQSSFGSWVQYGIFPSGTVQGTASGAAFAGPGLVNPAVCDYSTLTFTNAATSTCASNQPVGNYQSTQTIPSVVSRFPGGTNVTGSTINLGQMAAANDPSGVYTDTSSNALSITGGTGMIPAGKWYVIKVPNAKVTITGNITYTNSSTLTSIQSIPQVVIIAGDITIADNVTDVDSWLIAQPNSTGTTTGTINTCSEAPTTKFTINICNQVLTVNGPVMAQRLYMNRTGGSGTGADIGQPAEVFNLRADAYFWAYEQALSQGSAQTVYTSELPPRF